MPSVRVRKGPLAFVPLESDQVAVIATDSLNPNAASSSIASQRHQNARIAVPLTHKHSSSLRSEPAQTSTLNEKEDNEIRTTRPRRKTFSGAHALIGSAVGQDDGLSTQMRKSGTTTFGRGRSQSWVADSILQRAWPREDARNSTRNSAIVSSDTSPRIRNASVGGSGELSINVSIPGPSIGELAGSALSLNDAENLEMERNPVIIIPDNEHHLNEIVEHLDVIDAHISTVAHLCNTANSILIPPLSFYSRIPVVPLPTRATSPPLTPIDPESGRPLCRERTNELDEHVEDVLGKRARIRRAMQGLWAFLKTPMGIATGIYGFLVVFWGAAIVLFLGKLIDLHNEDQQSLWIEISSQVVNGLFTIQGVGFLPWRIMDTYHIAKIWQFKRLSRRLREKNCLPPLEDEDDLPDPELDPDHIPLLNDGQQAELRHHQEKFRKSQTWYRPHATNTHKAFSINTALLICLLVDGNSFFQCMLCGIMWGLTRFTRPPWATATLVVLSFSCGILAGVFIWRGGERAKKTAEVEKRLREALTKEKRVLEERYGPKPSRTETGTIKPSQEKEPVENPQVLDEISSAVIEEEASPDSETRNSSV